MQETKDLLRHFLGALAYRTQKAVRGCAPSFPSFRVAPQVRSPHELVHHMDSVLGYARTFFAGGEYRVSALPTFEAEVARFHETLADLSRVVAEATEWNRISPKQLLQGPLCDAMTHAGQLALLRRLSGDPVPPENFVFASISSERLGPDQALPVSPDTEWPERPKSVR